MNSQTTYRRKRSRSRNEMLEQHRAILVALNKNHFSLTWSVIARTFMTPFSPDIGQ